MLILKIQIGVIAEVGTVLRKKRRSNMLAVQEADDLWLEFRQFPGVEYLSDDAVMDRF